MKPMEVKFFEDEPISIHLIQETFEAAFKIRFNENYWKWRFFENPFTDKLKIAYVLIEGKLAAYYAVNPVEICIDNHRQKIALSLMTMTHPNFSGQGLFKKISIALYEKLISEGFYAVYGFANMNSHYGFRKYLGWNDIMPLYTLNAIKIKPVELTKNIRIGDVDLSFLHKIASLQYSTGEIAINRDVKYLNYRLLKSPINSYKYTIFKKGNSIETAIIFKFYNDEIDIMEVFFKNNIEYLNSINVLLFNLNKKYGKGINIWSNFHSDEHIELEKIGFKPKEFNSFFGVIPLSQECNLGDFKKWHIRFLDSDIF